MTLESRLQKFNGVGPGFDFLRVALALSILFWHSFGISYGFAWTRTAVPPLPFPPILAALLPMFFALSGFLVMGSAIRTANLKVFITFRVLRILPALATEISLSALILGPIMTVLPLREYFSDPQFWVYFGSLVGRVQYVLPGLFVTNPTPFVVNGALWTVGPEILCYIIMAWLMLFGWYRSRPVMVGFTLVFLGVCVFSDQWAVGPINEILPTKALIFSFLVGNLLYLYRGGIPYSIPLAILFFLAGVGLNYAAQSSGSLRIAIYPAAAAFAYVTAVIGLTKIGELPFFKGGDYSYGIYIYGYPIQQMVAHFLPEHREWYVNLAIALPVTLLFAYCSWHAVEKPVLRLRKKILGQKKSVEPERLFSWRPRPIALASFLAVYGAYVIFTTGIFPLREVARSMVGKSQEELSKKVVPPF